MDKNNNNGINRVFNGLCQYGFDEEILRINTKSLKAMTLNEKLIN